MTKKPLQTISGNHSEWRGGLSRGRDVLRNTSIFMAAGQAGNKRSGHPSSALSSHRNVIKTFVTGSQDGSLKLPKTLLRHCERMITFLRLTNELVLSRLHSCIALDEWIL